MLLLIMNELAYRTGRQHAGKILVLVLIQALQIFSQSIYSPSNIKKFADYLFCTKDYLRSALEYQKYQDISFNDTVQYKIGFAYSTIGNYQEAEKELNKIPSTSELYFQGKLELMRAIFLSKDYGKFRDEYQNLNSDNPGLRKLYNFSFLEDTVQLPNENNFLKPFPNKEKNEVGKFYKFKNDPPYKNSLTAAILSVIIPGAGKIYTDKISDGITSFILVGLMTFLSVDNFNAHHNFRGWVFAGASVFFYAGNIYGSAASAQIYNSQLDYNFSVGINAYLKNNDYFLPEINFCR
jgi:TM2 domain-containing membrane protein YozV